MRAADGLRGRLGESEEAHLPLLDQAGHRPDGLLNRHFGVNPVLVVEVYDLDAEAAQGSLAGRAHILRLPADAEEAGVRAADVAELGG